jgi:hypothetical protein
MLEIVINRGGNGAMSETITVIDAARKYGFHTSYLAVLLRMGLVDGHKDQNGHWVIKAASLEAYRKRTKRGRKPRKQEAAAEVPAGA